jgi:hypothetical protein
MTWLENEQDMTTVVLATIQTKQPASSLTERGVAGTAAEVDETALGEEDDVAARGHGEAVDLGLDVDVLDRVLLEPGDVNLDVKVADAVAESAKHTLATDALQRSKGHMASPTHLDTMASSGMASKCLAVMMSLLPVVVTKMFARGAASSIVVTS